jgi:hypothetical protein
MDFLQPPSNPSLKKRKSEEELIKDEEHSKLKDIYTQLMFTVKESKMHKESMATQIWVNKQIKMRKRNLVAFCCFCEDEKGLRNNECMECGHLSSRCNECLLVRSQKLVAFCCICQDERWHRDNECMECSHLSSVCSECLHVRSQKRRTRDAIEWEI